MAGYNATMRVLHIANFSWFTSRGKRLDDWARYYSTDRKISHGLIRNGHSVWDFSYRDTARFLSPLGLGKRGGKTRMHRHLLDLAGHLSPDWILLGHCELLSGEVLASLRKILPNARIAQWWVDWFADSSLPSIREKQPCLDAFFATTAPDFVRGRLGDCATPLYFMPNIVDFVGGDGARFCRFLHSIRSLFCRRRGFGAAIAVADGDFGFPFAWRIFRFRRPGKNRRGGDGGGFGQESDGAEFEPRFGHPPVFFRPFGADYRQWRFGSDAADARDDRFVC